MGVRQSKKKKSGAPHSKDHPTHQRHKQSQTPVWVLSTRRNCDAVKKAERREDAEKLYQLEDARKKDE